MPDTETYLHRIGRTGRFGRIGVSISLVHDSNSWRALSHIGDFFGVPLTGIDTSDWDAVESAVKRVIKTSRKENAAAEENQDEMFMADGQAQSGRRNVEAKADEGQQTQWGNSSVQANNREQGNWQDMVVTADKPQQDGWRADDKQGKSQW